MCNKRCCTCCFWSVNRCFLSARLCHTSTGHWECSDNGLGYPDHLQEFAASAGTSSHGSGEDRFSQRARAGWRERIDRGYKRVPWWPVHLRTGYSKQGIAPIWAGEQRGFILSSVISDISSASPILILGLLTVIIIVAPCLISACSMDKQRAYTFYKIFEMLVSGKYLHNWCDHASMSPAYIHGQWIISHTILVQTRLCLV